MRVRLKYKWFAPSDPYNHTDGRVFKGQSYEKGEHDLDPSMRPFLPRSAEILDDEEFVDPVVEKTPEEQPKEETLRDYDMDRKSDDQLVEKLKEAEKNADLVTSKRKTK